MVIKSKTLQIAWHADENGRNQPINGLDVHPTLPIIATCSLDAKVHIWRIKTTVPVPPNVSVASPAASSSPEGAVAAPSSASGPQASTSPAGSRPAADVDVEFLFALTGHMRTVNAVRFSPNGSLTDPYRLQSMRWCSATAFHAIFFTIRLLSFGMICAGECLATASDGELGRWLSARLCFVISGVQLRPHHYTLTFLCSTITDNTIIVWRPQGDLTWLGCQNERHTSRTCLRCVLSLTGMGHEMVRGFIPYRAIPTSIIIHIAPPARLHPLPAAGIRRTCTTWRGRPTLGSCCPGPWTDPPACGTW